MPNKMLPDLVLYYICLHVCLIKWLPSWNHKQLIKFTFDDGSVSSKFSHFYGVNRKWLPADYITFQKSVYTE